MRYILLFIISFPAFSEGLIHNPDLKNINVECPLVTLDSNDNPLPKDSVLAYTLYIQDSKPYDASKAIKLISNNTCKFINPNVDRPDGQYYFYVITGLGTGVEKTYSLPSSPGPIFISRGPIRLKINPASPSNLKITEY